MSTTRVSKLESTMCSHTKDHNSKIQILSHTGEPCSSRNEKKLRSDLSYQQCIDHFAAKCIKLRRFTDYKEWMVSVLNLKTSLLSNFWWRCHVAGNWKVSCMLQTGVKSIYFENIFHNWILIIHNLPFECRSMAIISITVDLDSS